MTVDLKKMIGNKNSNRQGTTQDKFVMVDILMSNLVVYSNQEWIITSVQVKKSLIYTDRP